MKCPARLLSLALLFALTGCAVLSQPELAAIRERRVAPATLQKLAHAEPLLPQDVIELTRRAVPQEQIHRYITRTGVNFLLTQDDSTRMRQAGVSANVIDLMASESAKFAADYRARHEVYYSAPTPLFVDPIVPY